MFLIIRKIYLLLYRTHVNNSKKTVITVEAEGITTDGKPVVWKSETDKTYSR